ncbi:MAG: hypothetical protein KGN40_01740, partial [Burkholderiales bacterium]|nr:hypothetical protein [Burkholderiales bacterium]
GEREIPFGVINHNGDMMYSEYVEGEGVHSLGVGQGDDKQNSGSPDSPKSPEPSKELLKEGAKGEIF